MTANSKITEAPTIGALEVFANQEIAVLGDKVNQLVKQASETWMGAEVTWGSMRHVNPVEQKVTERLFWKLDVVAFVKHYDSLQELCDDFKEILAKGETSE